MSLNPPFSGGCLCGAVSYRVTAEPVAKVQCHCTDCQKVSGATAVSLYLVPRDALTAEGDMTEFEKTGDSGHKARMTFCAKCCTRLFGFPDAAPHLVTVTAMSLDEPEAFAPDANIFTRSACHWDVMDPDLPAFEALPPQG